MTANNIDVNRLYPSKALLSPIHPVADRRLVGNPVNKNWWVRERDHQLLEEEELWRYY
jgi:hypothetical protein